jgi:hypothetical protein
MVTCEELKKLAAKLIHPVYPNTGVIIVGQQHFSIWFWTQDSQHFL